MSKEKKRSEYSVFLLGVFAAGLIWALIIVKIRSGIQFSEPLSLQSEGISASVPVGNGWQQTEQWGVGESNNFKLEAQLILRGKSKAGLVWTVLPAAFQTEPGELIRVLAIQRGVSITSDGLISRDGIDFHWILTDSNSEGVCFAICASRLESGRTLRLEIASAEQPNLAESLLNGAVKTVNYTHRDIFKTSSEFMQNLKDNGAFNLTGLRGKSEKTENIYLLTRAGQKVTGFSIDIFERVEDKRGITGLQARTNYYNKEFRQWANITGFFECTPDLETYNWQSSSAGPVGGVEKNMILEESQGVLTVSNGVEETKYRPSDIALPEVFIDGLITEFSGTGSGNDETYTDFITSNGTIIPSRLYMKEKTNEPDEIEAKKIVRLELFYNKDKYIDFFLDDEGIIIGRLETYSGREVLWIRSDRSQLAEIFGKWEQFIR